MSEQILKALMQLFAIIARPESNLQDRRSVVESFLKRQLNKELVEEYLKVFDEFYNLYQKKQKETDLRRRRISASSVRVLKICTDINEELAQPQKIIVLLQLLEFVKSDVSEITNQEMEFINTVAETFNVSKDEYKRMKEFVLLTFEQIPDDPDILVIDEKEDSEYEKISTKHLQSESLLGMIRVLNIRSSNLYFIRYMGVNEIYMNGQLLEMEKVYAFNYGSSIRNQQIKPVYYSDIVSRFAEDRIKSKIAFEVKNVEYKFKSGKTGLHNVSFTEYSGSLVGIMGASGAGKSTLLNVLNGSIAPISGSVLINGVNIHTEKNNIEGIIGHVSQDDLLIEELTVFQNLYYNAKLCFNNYSEEQLAKAVEKVLKNLGLNEIQDIQVGSPLNKKISGGQRKRLNIALELIREPAVLFLDEPTSGLSSRDSENILDLLKELSLKGKLVFVVIHQPSSDIFKMFDKLLILDTGGFLIYNGNPVDSIVYFKSRIHHANWNESECHACGNVNPEQIFNIVESSVLDEYGKITGTRKISPTEWSKFYQENEIEEESLSALPGDLPEISFKIPGRIKQLWIFVCRDILKKLSDTQYLVINFLEAPVLAFLLAYIIKYYSVDVANEFGYTLESNSNLPVYLFMSVIVGIFMGLTGSAEEIIKDRKILKREAFLNLSWSGYLLFKSHCSVCPFCNTGCHFRNYWQQYNGNQGHVFSILAGPFQCMGIFKPDGPGYF
jgi:ABC transport system ATP-binding/permease protein